MSDFDFEKDVHIDKLRLDEEWLKQAGLMARYSKLKAQAKRKLNKALEFKKTVRSEIILSAKREGGDRLLKVDKVTDSAIEAYYRTQKRYIDAKDAEIQAEFEYNMLEGAIDAIRDRKHELQDLVSLHLADYWSDPKEPDGSNMETKARKAYDGKQREALKNSIKRSKRNE